MASESEKRTSVSSRTSLTPDTSMTPRRSMTHRMSVTQMTQMINTGEHTIKVVRWSDIPEVQETFINRKNLHLINLYESKFEIIPQEVCFNLSLRSLLCARFLTHILGDKDRTIMFGSLHQVLKVSDAFLADLEICWQRDIFLKGIYDVIRKHEADFAVVEQYCANQKKTLQNLHKLKSESPEFLDACEKWQTSPENYSKLVLESILSLPQRDMVSIALSCQYAAHTMLKTDSELKSCLAACKAIKKVALKCEQGVGMIDPMTSLLKLMDQLVFADHVTPIPIITNNRALLRNEELTLLTLSGGNISKRSPRQILLFSDLIVIAKRVKRDDKYSILDYCQLSAVELKSTEDLLNIIHSSALADIQKKLLLIKLKENYEKKAVSLLFACPLEASCDIWTRLLEPPIKITKPLPEPVEEVAVLVAEQPLPSRTTDQMRIIEELKIKQELRKKDYHGPEEAMDEFNDILQEKAVVSNQDKPFLIPRPVSRPVSFRASEPPPVLPKPHTGGAVVTVTTTPHTTVAALAPPLEMKPPDPQHNKSSVEETITFAGVLDFPKDMTVFPLLSATRWKIIKADFIQRWHFADRKHSDTKLPIHVTLFNDVLFITTKKKNDRRHVVRSYAMRNLVYASRLTRSRYQRYPLLPSKLRTDSTNKFMFLIDILENQRRQPETIVVCATTEKERDNWLQALPYHLLSPPDVTTDYTYDPWDRPIVTVVQAHLPSSRYEIPLAVHDMLHVNKRRADGWYEGERVSDGRTGMFPVKCTVELESQHKYAREMRQRAASLLKPADKE